MRRKGRVFLGVGLIGLGGWTVVPGLIHPISTDAMINAEVVTLRAPIDGTFGASPLAVGDPIEAGQTVGRVHAFRPDTVRRDQLALELVAQRRLVQALIEEAAGMAGLDRDLNARGKAYRAAVEKRLALGAVEAAARRAGAEAVLSRARAELARKQALQAKDLIAPAALEAVRADERAASAAVDGARAAAARAAGEADAAKHGVFIGDGFNNVPYTQQRRDELRLNRAARRVEAAQAAVKAAELDRQFAAEAEAVKRSVDAVLHSPASGVVWQRFAAEGDGIRLGDPVLGVIDCRSLFLTAVLPKRFFADLRAGDRAGVSLQGSDSPVAAVVQSVRAAGGTQATPNTAVSPAAEEGRDIIVTLAVHDHRLGRRADNLCQVGQQASVTFAMPALQPFFEAVAGRAAELVRRLGGGGGDRHPA